MSLISHWFRHLKNVGSCATAVRAQVDPFGVFTKDPFFRDAITHCLKSVTPGDIAGGLYSNSEVKIDEKKVEIHLDIENYTPEQINVKTVGNEITVVGNKQASSGNGWMQCHFERKFILPYGFPPEGVECHFDQGKLVVQAFKSHPQPEDERIVSVLENKIIEASESKSNK